MPLAPLQPLPLLPGIGRQLPRRRQQPAYQSSEEDERSLLAKIGGGMLSGLGMVGAGLDLPSSIGRDILGGITTGDWTKYNPIDQLGSPLSFENRQFGRDIMTDWGWQRPNKETGIKGWLDDPMEGVRDVGGFAFDVLTDPLSYLTFGGASRSAAGQAVKRAGLEPVAENLRQGGIAAGSLTENARRLRGLTDAGKFVGPRRARQMQTIEDVIEASGTSMRERLPAFRALEDTAGGMGKSIDELSGQPLGQHFGLALPFGDPMVTFNAGPIGRGLSQAFDVTGDLLKKFAPVRAARGLLDPKAGSQFDRVGQEISEHMHESRKFGAGPESREASRVAGNEYRELVDTLAGQESVLRGTDEFHPHDLRLAAEEELPRFLDQYENLANQALREFRRENPGWTAVARGEGDYTRIPGYDETFREWFSGELPGAGGGVAGGRFPNLYSSPDELMDALREGRGTRTARPTRNSPEVLEAAQERLRQNPEPGAFAQGEVVRAGDRSNYGYVTRPGRERSTVFFRSPEGETATRELSNDILRRAFDNPQEAAEASQKFSELHVRGAASDLIRATTDLGSAEEAFRRLHPELLESLGENAPDVLRQFDETAARWHTERGRTADDIIGYGGKLDKLEETLFEGDSFKTGYFPRSVGAKTQKELMEVSGRARLLPSSMESTKARTAVTRNLPTYVRDKILTDDAYRGDNAARNILRDFDEFLENEWGRDRGAFSPEMFEEAAEGVGKQAHADALADWAVGKPRRGLTGDAFEDHTRYMQKATALRDSLKAMHDVAHRYARAGEGGVRLPEAFRRAGLQPDQAVQAFTERFGAEAVGKRVPEEFVRGMSSVVEYFNRGPAWHGKIADWIDGFTQWFKTNVTVPFPGFLSRNLSSGQMLNISTMVKGPRELVKYTGDIKYAKSLLGRAQKAVESGQGIGALEEADRKILEEVFKYSVIDPRQMFEVGDIFKSGRGVADDPLEGLVPGRILDVAGHKGRAAEHVAENPIRFDPFDTMSKTGAVDELGRPAARALDDIPGVPAGRRGWRRWVEHGVTANKQVEWMNRVTLFKFLRDKGFAPKQAAKEVIARHFDYSDVSDFSRSVMKRAFPFFTFSSKILPLTAKELAERPGGGLGQTIRATNMAAGGEDEPLPQRVRETTSIPLGSADDGTQRFLTGLGLAHEDPLAFAGGLRTAGMEALSRSNPLFKAPVEWFTGESFFQRGPTGGRDLEQMDPLVGRLLTNVGLQEEDPLSGRAKPFINPLTEQVISNSPISRLLSTARQITDERKRQNPTLFPGDALALNVLTGLKTTDVSPQAQDAVLRDMMTPVAMSELGGRSFENVYIPKATIEETRARGDEERAKRMEAYNLLKNLLARRTKERKAAEK